MPKVGSPMRLVNEQSHPTQFENATGFLSRKSRPSKQSKGPTPPPKIIIIIVPKSFENMS